LLASKPFMLILFCSKMRTRRKATQHENVNAPLLVTINRIKDTVLVLACA